MQTRNAWWLTLISAGMVVYGAAAVWSLLPPRWAGHDPLMLVVSAAVAIVGAVCLVRDLARQPEDDSPRSLASSVEPYVLAWRRLWSTRWLLWVYGCIAAISVAGSLVGQACWYFIYSRGMSGQGAAYAGGVVEHTPAERFLQFLWSELAYSSLSVFHKFIPRIDMPGATILMPIVVLLVLYWVLPRLSRLSRESERSGSVVFFGACLVLLLIAYAVTATLGLRQISEAWAIANPAPAPASAFPSEHASAIAQSRSAFAGQRAIPSFWPPLMAISFFVGTIVNAVFVGAVLGSLARLRRGQIDIKETFLGDAVRYFAPLVGICLVFIMGLSPIYWLLILCHVPSDRLQFFYVTPLFVILLMYAPMGVVTQGVGFVAAIKHSLRVWRETAWRTVSLIATGVFLSALVMIPLRAVEVSFMKNSWPRIPIGLVYQTAGIGIGALIFLAVWEFYSAQVLERPDLTEIR